MLRKINNTEKTHPIYATFAIRFFEEAQRQRKIGKGRWSCAKGYANSRAEVYEAAALAADALGVAAGYPASLEEAS